MSSAIAFKISLTDLARYANPEEPKIPIQTWMRNKNVVSFLGLWEKLHNVNFKGIEFTTFEKSQEKAVVQKVYYTFSDVVTVGGFW